MRLAQHVLPSVSDHAGPDAHRPLGHDMPLEAWSLGPLAPMGEDSSAGTYALIPVCTARLNTSGHQIAQISLGAIFGAPTLPHKGHRGCHFALVNPATGNLTWRAYLAGGDFDKPDTMDKIATALVSHLSGTM
ncbi:MAG: hypothetical protein MRY64_07080 [Hyphomonadaceae bacterium]|nr:hypothetical protein [Hyphomonadaceae bacterium]